MPSCMCQWLEIKIHRNLYSIEEPCFSSFPIIVHIYSIRLMCTWVKGTAKHCVNVKHHNPHVNKMVKHLKEWFFLCTVTAKGRVQAECWGTATSPVFTQLVEVLQMLRLAWLGVETPKKPLCRAVELIPSQSTQSAIDWGCSPAAWPGGSLLHRLPAHLPAEQPTDFTQFTL